MQVKVIHTASLQPEYLVNLEDDLILPCFAFYKPEKILVTWRLNDKVISGPQILSNGSIHIKKYVAHLSKII